MSALEALVSASGEANLSESLSFELPATSSAIVDRQFSCRAYPTSASTLTPTGTRTCRIRLGGDAMVAPSSIRLRYTIQNLDTTPVSGATNSASVPSGGVGLDLAPVSGPWCVWSLVRVLANGVEVDNIPQYGRMHEQFAWRLLTQEQQLSEAMYGWHSSYTASPANGPHPVPGMIAGGASVTVSHKLMTSLTTQNKFLALRYAPLDLEFSLGNASDAFFGSYVHSGTTKVTSQNYAISNIQVCYQASILDESVQESFYRALLASRVLNTPLQQAFQIVQSIPSGSTSYTFSIVRAFSKLTHVWITFRSKDGNLNTEFLCPSAQNAKMIASYGSNPYFSDEMPSPSIRVSLGAKNHPQFEPVATQQEHFSQLMEVLGAAPMLDRKDYLTNTWMSCFDLRRTPGDAASAMSTRQGDQLRVDIKGLTPWTAAGTAPQGPTEVWITLLALGVLATRESGCQLLD